MCKENHRYPYFAILIQYIKIKLSNESRTRFPNYGLYAYGEGKMAEALRENKFTGIPVLFIPGNSGSHKQVNWLLISYKSQTK